MAKNDRQQDPRFATTPGQSSGVLSGYQQVVSPIDKKYVRRNLEPYEKYGFPQNLQNLSGMSDTRLESEAADAVIKKFKAAKGGGPSGGGKPPTGGGGTTPAPRGGGGSTPRRPTKPKPRPKPTKPKPAPAPKQPQKKQSPNTGKPPAAPKPAPNPGKPPAAPKKQEIPPKPKAPTTPPPTKGGPIRAL